MRKRRLTKARERVVHDLLRQTREAKSMSKDVRLEWKIRGYVHMAEYWIIAYNFPIAILLYFLTGSYWFALAFWIGVQLYTLSANFRGMSLHIENFVEYFINKTI